MRRGGCLLACLVLLAGCAGEQSAFSAAGEEAISTLRLTWILTLGSVLVFLLVTGALVAALGKPGGMRRRLADPRMVTLGGIVFPMVVLAILLVYSFALLRAGPASAGAAPLNIAIEGKQWWWRVTYSDAPGGPVESANELRIPVGETVRLELTSADVIHSFWVPAYAGKVDMIPGRTNALTLKVTAPGIVRGQCTEYCGGAHALMAFTVIAMPPADYAAWLEREAAPAAQGLPGEGEFLRAGCGACHTVRGTPAEGTAGPDLTHVASRQTIGAGILATNPENFRAWLARHREIKPGNLMPEYDFLSPAEREAIATYLEALE